jgi:beta-glucanase (GH16 family)
LQIGMGGAIVGCRARIRAVSIGLALAAMTSSGGANASDGPARLLQPVNWGSPDQPYGKRRPLTAADRTLVQSYRAGHQGPVFSTSFSDPAELQADWNLMSDDGRMCRRPANVEVSGAGLRLKTLAASADCRNKTLKWSTGSVASKATYRYGFFEATMKIADIRGMNNAFWMNTANQTATGDYFEIDVSEVQYPSYDHIGLQQYPAKAHNVPLSTVKHTGMGWGAQFVDDLSAAFHDYGVLWTRAEMIFEIDGEPVAAVVTDNSVNAPADVMFSSALIYPGVPDHPEGHDLVVKSLRVFSLR